MENHFIIKHMCYTSSSMIQLLVDPSSFSNVLFPSIFYFSGFLFVIIVLYYICMCNVHTVVKVFGKLIMHTFNFNLVLGSKWIWCQTNIINCVFGEVLLTQYNVTFQKHRWKFINLWMGWKLFWIVKETDYRILWS